MHKMKNISRIIKIINLNYTIYQWYAKIKYECITVKLFLKPENNKKHYHPK